MKTRKLTTLSMLTAIALTIFMVEAQIPALVPIPGVKMGLANIVTVFVVFAIGAKEGVLVLAAIIMGRYASSPGVAVMVTAMAIWPMEWAMAPQIPATHSCFLVRIFRSPMVTRIAHRPPAPE